MNETSLQKLIDEVLDEAGETKRANKAKKTAAQSKAGASMQRSWKLARNADKTDLQLGRSPMAAPTPLRGDFGSKSKGAGDARKMADGRRSFGSDFPLSQRKAYPGSLAGDMDTVRGLTQSMARAAAGGSVPIGGSAAPAQVQAAVQSGGKVVFGRYYDASGQYLGRTQGGKWVDGKTDPNAKTQMEMYNKLMEIEAGKYTSKDREMVKEMIREVMRSCR